MSALNATTTRPQSRAPRVWWSFPIARIAGIQVRVHVTFLMLLAFVAWASSFPGGPGAFAGSAWLLLIFACVLGHEFAHCLVARRHGVAVHEIVLLPIGGVSKLEEIPERWYDEFVIAIAGPIASIALAIVFAVAALVLRVPLLPIDFLESSLVVRLMWLNLVLAGFNIIPAFPLDGGRVFRSLLERKHDRATATQWAARVGRMFAITLMAVGFFFDFWLFIIGVFVYFGASVEERATLAHLRLAPLHVGDVAVDAPIVLSSSVAAGVAARSVAHALQPIFPVVEVGEYLGACTATQLRALPGNQLCREAIDDAIPVFHIDDDLEGALAALATDGETGVVLDGQQRVAGLLRLEEIRHVLAGETVVQRAGP